MPVITLANHKQFETMANETILDGALRTSIVLEHSCKTGRCGTCKAEVLLGNTVPLIDEVALTAVERASRWILTCARSAIDDVQLLVEDLGNERLPAPRTFPCRIKSLEKLAPDVIKVVLRLPSQQTLEYRSGQYVDIIGISGIRRSYSMANAPLPNNTIELHIRQVPGGMMSRYWFEDAKVNDLLRLHGPSGTFFLRDIKDDDLIFLATGTGIAPIKALLESLFRHETSTLKSSVHVFWGGRSLQDLYWNPAEVGNPLRYTPVLSRAGGDWTGARGHVQDVALAVGSDLTRAQVYACGSPAMIEGARALFLNHGLASHRFHSDAFVSSS